MLSVRRVCVLLLGDCPNAIFRPADTIYGHIGLIRWKQIPPSSSMNQLMNARQSPQLRRSYTRSCKIVAIVHTTLCDSRSSKCSSSPLSFDDCILQNIARILHNSHIHPRRSRKSTWHHDRIVIDYHRYNLVHASPMFCIFHWAGDLLLDHDRFVLLSPQSHICPEILPTYETPRGWLCVFLFHNFSIITLSPTDFFPLISFAQNITKWIVGRRLNINKKKTMLQDHNLAILCVPRNLLFYEKAK